jgi:hypothetical protein
LHPSFLFQKPEFLKRQGSYILLEESGIRIALIGEANLFSPARAPFGGFEFEAGTGPVEFSRMLNCLDEYAAKNKIESLEIVLPPDTYCPDRSGWVLDLLSDFDYKPVYRDLNFHLDTSGSFHSNLHRSERWKLKKAEREGFEFKQIVNPDWDFVHSFVLASRERKGYKLSMTKTALEDSYFSFPGVYRVWRVDKDLECAAIAVTVTVCEEIEYIFYTADDLKFRRFSPVVMLHDGLFKQALIEKRRILDMGTASLMGEVNQGVADFKQFLGGIEGNRFCLRKSWHQ